ncbi:spliceosome-associated protein CWC27 homolog [Cylas formicarius]|uniref:spliceosome-associated protein CWC27 homolog n=1 Tax=Cylas formicarius TaxID=197179 RepID=UPI002958A33A|nr:spliceosome-associated protein CWC27 homolog [Cylas formicarius]
MSNIYILEPPTSGKILLKTTAGDIDIELWSKETPTTCRNFIQLCLEGYYDNTIFHRVVKNFIVQGGDPSGNGTGGESIYGEPFKDEFHQRLRFTRRGLVAMANAGKDDNGSQFFFTLAATPELQNKHTIFAKVTGDTVFNMLKLAEGLIEDERPVYPYKILKTEVLHNPFDDIVPRVKETVVKEKKKKEKIPGVKNFKLLSFGEEAEEDEEVSARENVKLSGKGKSSHDMLNDPKLSAQTDKIPEIKEEEIDAEEQLENIRKKLKTGHKKSKPASSRKSQASEIIDVDDDADLEEYYLHKDRDMERKKKVEELKKEIQNIKKEYRKNKIDKNAQKEENLKKEQEKNAAIKDFEEEYNVYKSKNKALPKKGAGREEFTLQLLEEFKKKLRSVKEVEPESDAEENKDEEREKDWYSHELHFTDNTVLAKDANTKDDDWFEIYDPRNPLNKRRRGEPTTKK